MRRTYNRGYTYRPARDICSCIILFFRLRVRLCCPTNRIEIKRRRRKGGKGFGRRLDDGALGRYLQCIEASFLYHITSHHVFKEGVCSLLYVSSFPLFRITRSYVLFFFWGGDGGGRDGERRKKKRVAVLIEVSVVLQWLLSTSRAAYYSSALSIQCSGWPSLSNLFLFFIFYFFVILCWPLATYEL